MYPTQVYLFGGNAPGNGYYTDMYRLDINSTLDGNWSYLNGDEAVNLYGAYGPIGNFEDFIYYLHL